MCGVLVSAGTGPLAGAEVFPELLRLLDPRGPDERWHSRTERLEAGSTRLSLFGTATTLPEANPQDSAVLVLMNGEIWNFSELNSDLQIPVHTELELIRQGYLEHGIEYIARIDGMFFIAILDTTSNVAYFARDAAGIKPAFFIHFDQGRSLVAASDVKPLCNYPGFEVRTNQNYLINNYVFSYSDYDDCLVEGVHQIPPGQYLRADLADPQRIHCTAVSYRYARGAQRDLSRTALDAQLDLLERAVGKCLGHKDSSEVGLLLSGGIDSSLIAMVARRLGMDGVVCFYAGLRGTADYRWASWVAQQTGYELRHIEPNSRDVMRGLPRYCYQLSGEKGIVAAILAEEIKKHFPEIKIVLCGEGSDELYGGYRWYTESPLTFARIQARAAELKQSTPLISQFQTMAGACATGDESVERLLDFFLGAQLINNHLLQLDHGFMAHGIELRVPFLDAANVEFARQLPLGEKLSGGRTKAILKDLLSTVFSAPEEFVERPKLGFPSSMPRAVIDLESLARALIPTRWRCSHPLAGTFRSCFDMMWFDLTCLVLLNGMLGPRDEPALLDLYSSENTETIYRTATR